jgi:hypothetical protein
MNPAEVFGILLRAMLLASWDASSDAFSTVSLSNDIVFPVGFLCWEGSYVSSFYS